MVVAIKNKKQQSGNLREMCWKSRLGNVDATDDIAEKPINMQPWTLTEPTANNDNHKTVGSFCCAMKVIPPNTGVSFGII